MVAHRGLAGDRPAHPGRWKPLRRFPPALGIYGGAPPSAKGAQGDPPPAPSAKSYIWCISLTAGFVYMCGSGGGLYLLCCKYAGIFIDYMLI